MPTFRAMVVALALPAVPLGGCASVPAAKRAQAREDCINTREINVMRPLDDKHVFVKVGAYRNYLLTVEDPCHDLHLARKLEVFEASSRVCSDGVSLLAFEVPATGPMRCRVTKIDSVKDLNAAIDLSGAEVPPKQP